MMLSSDDLSYWVTYCLQYYSWLIVTIVLRYVVRYWWISKALIPSRLVPNNVSDIADYISTNELKSHSDSPLKTGAEKHVWWANGQGIRTKYAIVYVHGFSACRQECHPVVETVAKNLSWNVFYTRLSGHGGANPASKMQNCRSDALVQDIHEALKIGEVISEEGIVLIGMSTGGALSSFGLTTEMGRRIVKKTVLISPAFGFHISMMNLVSRPYMFGDHSIRGLLLRLVLGNYDSWEGQTEKQNFWWSTIYPSYALLGVMDAVGLANWSIARAGTITTPILCIASKKDKVVNYQHMREALSMSSAVQFFCPPYECNNHHCIVGRNVSPSSVQSTIEKIMEFLQDMP